MHAAINYSQPRPITKTPMLDYGSLPRVRPDTYCDTLAEAVDELMRRRSDAGQPPSMTRIEESPYGEGYRVFSVVRKVPPTIKSPHRYTSRPAIKYGDSLVSRYGEDLYR